MTHARPIGSGTMILGGGVLLAAVVVAVFLLPMFDCGLCAIGRAFAMGLANMGRLEPLPESAFPLKGCEFCWRGKVTLYRKLKLERELRIGR